jgi:DNA-binding beta-propeller fold protein YncE
VRGAGLMKQLLVPLLVGTSVVLSLPGQAAESGPLVLEAKIPLGNVRGRIDHFAVDLRRQRLYVAELGNDSVGAVSLSDRQVRTITGLREPQGVGYLASTDTLYVANAGDGSVRVYRGDDLSPSGRIELGDDADNIRIDTRRNRVLVGYGSGALAVIDPAGNKKISDIPLKAHPEAFQLAEGGTQVFVNVPDARQIAAIDLASGKQTLTLSPEGARSNFPMAVDDERHRILVAFRRPPSLLVFGTPDGGEISTVETCGDADDVFVDAKRRRVYVSCGEGVVDVLADRDSRYERVARVPTVSGARTSLFVPELDRLYVGVRASFTEPAAVWVFRPAP